MSTPEHSSAPIVIPNNTSPSEHSNSSDVEESPRENHTSEALKEEQTTPSVILTSELTPLGKRKRGRPKKNPSEKPADDGVPKVKRPRGRPKGSKNKNPKAKPIPIGPKRPRGRPRKWPPVEKPPPHLRRGRGRPRKDSQQQTQMTKSLHQLPTMVTFTESAPREPAEASMDSPITESDIGQDLVPPEDLFETDD